MFIIGPRAARRRFNEIIASSYLQLVSALDLPRKIIDDIYHVIKHLFAVAVAAGWRLYCVAN